MLPEGEITDPSQLPSSIPAYLISVIPELSLDGNVVGQGNAMQLGEELDFQYQILRRGQPGPDNYSYPVTAGSYLNVQMTGGSISPDKLAQLQAKLTATQATLQSGDAALIAGLSREDILGDMFLAGGMGYFGQYTALGNLQSISNKSRFKLNTGYGTFGYEPNVFYFFGFPRALNSGGFAVNVRVGWNVIPKNGDMSKWKGLNLEAGMLSSTLEHAVPEQMFNTDPANPVDGISAVKALQIAAQQGQKIYHITQQNQATVLPQLTISSSAKNEIIQGLNAGREVIAHANQISVPGFTGEGYIITDVVTGAGAYKITGGSNGGYYLLLGMLLAVFEVLVLFFVASVPLLILAGVLISIGTVLLLLALHDDPQAALSATAASFLTLIGSLVVITILTGTVFIAGTLPLFISIMISALGFLFGFLYSIYFAKLKYKEGSVDEIISV